MDPRDIPSNDPEVDLEDYETYGDDEPLEDEEDLILRRWEGDDS